MQHHFEDLPQVSPPPPEPASYNGGEYREERDPLYIRATVYVERDSQKAILIGNKGEAIRGLGGKVLKTSLSHDDEAQLQAALDAGKAASRAAPDRCSP